MVVQPTRCIGDYTVIKNLGAGATGKVKLALRPHTDELVALKIIHKDLLHRKRNLFTKVRREIAVMKLLTGYCMAAEKRRRQLHNSSEPPPDVHLGLMKLLDVYETDQSFVLVLEHCDGGELFDLLVQYGCLSEELALDLFQQLVHALEFCHKRGVCHRDLKPENVLLTADGRIKLADFGMSGLHTPGALLETSCGSPQYCAPEVISGEPYVGSTADIWSLGVVLYAMITGGLPFDDDNLHRLISKVNSGAFYMPEEVPHDLAALIQSMLTVDPSKRATLEEIKQSEWFNLRTPRNDVYVDEDDALLNAAHSLQDVPVIDPDRDIVHYLRDLGLGDDPTIRHRLRSKDRCIERDFYYQLSELCGDSLAFRPVENVPLSPKSSNNSQQNNAIPAPVHVEEPSALDQFQVIEDVAPCETASLSPNSVQPPWLHRFVDVLTLEGIPHELEQSTIPTGQYPVTAVNGVSSIPALRSVTSM